MKDSTKVKAGNKIINKNELDINASMAIKYRFYQHNRPLNKKDIIAFSLGKSRKQTIKICNLDKPFFSLKIVLTYGKNTFDNLLNFFSPDSLKLRCSWHAVKSFKWVLKNLCNV
jgi:hypothetical protein